MSRKIQMHRIGGIFVMLTFCVFAACVLMVLTSGAQSYQVLSDRDAESWNSRTCVQYIAARVRHADAAKSVFVGSFDGAPSENGDTLFLNETVNGTDYCTRIYCYDGQLRELFADEESGFSPKDGTAVLEAQQIRFSLNDRLLCVDAVDASGKAVSITLSLRSAEGAAS